MAMTLLIGILAVIGVAAIVGAVLVAMQPSDFTVSRSATMAAPPQRPFGLVNDFHEWERWSPWAKLDPNQVVSFEGAPKGEGAVFTWSGDKNVGEGCMTILESHPSERIRIRLEFFKPMKGVNDTVFTFAPSGGQTTVTWTMTGKNNFIGRVMCLLMNMDKMVGSKFDEGLASMKTIVEGAA